MITTFEFENDPSIVMSSKVVMAYGCKPARIVLRKLSDVKWVTHLETLGLEGNVWKHDGFHHGHYFEVVEDGTTEIEFIRLAGEEYGKAVADYKARCERL